MSDEAKFCGTCGEPIESPGQVCLVDEGPCRESGDREKLRIRVEATQWAEYEVEAHWFPEIDSDDADELWDAVVEMYGAEPLLAFDNTEEQNWLVKIKRVGSDDFLHRAHLEPGELLPEDAGWDQDDQAEYNEFQRLRQKFKPHGARTGEKS